MSGSSPINISYSDDEVKVFHVYVEKALKGFLKNNSLYSKYKIEHHPGGVVGTVPDFVIVEKSSGKWLFVIEVKRTPGSVRSIRTWDQARSYVRNNKAIHWSTTSKPYFMVTNIELNYFLCDRIDAATQFCLLKSGEETCSYFGNDAKYSMKDFETIVLTRVFNLLEHQTEDYSDNLKVILDDFLGLQEDLTSYLAKTVPGKLRANPKKFGFKDLQKFNEKIYEWKRLNDPRAKRIDSKKINREIARDSLLRIFTYEYCREFFKTINVSSALKPIQKNSKTKLETSINLSFSDLEKIDFSQIISSRLIHFVPENIDDKTFQMLKKFLTRIHSEMANVIKENGTPNYLLNLIMENEKFYPWVEANGDGKIMTDAELSDFVSTLCFNIFNGREPPHVFDPCSGTGNLLSSCYDRIKSKYPDLSHNKILSNLHGNEVDAFLGKLGVFGLIMRSPKEINHDTEIDIRLSDFFELEKSDIQKYDVVIMNPPFLRNDNKVSNLQREIIERKVLRALGKKSVMVPVSQPNFFFYFVEMATQLLKNEGVAGYFIMKSVLNTQNGALLKRFLLQNFDINYLVVCPRIFFHGYRVSPCIFIGTRKRKPNNENVVKFIQVISPSFFITSYEDHLKKKVAENGDVRIKSIKQKNLKAEADWKKHLLPIPSFYNLFRTSEHFSSLEVAFKNVKRGELANQGNGSQFFFPWSNSHVKKSIGNSLLNKIEKKFMKCGLENSRTQKNYILTKTDLTHEQCLAVPKFTDLNKFPGLAKFIKKFDNNYTRPNRWEIDDMNSKAQIVIPRASRKIHSVLLNPYWCKSDVYFSSNFVCLWNCNVSAKNLTQDQILKFLVAFLNSSFGQTMFEIECQDREGLRKVEKGIIAEKIFVPMKGLSTYISEIKEIIVKFEKLDYGLTGFEDIPSPRYDLDFAIAKLLLKLEPEFRKFVNSADELAKESQKNLRELVRGRLEI